MKSTEFADTDILTVLEAARFLKVGKDTVY